MAVRTKREYYAWYSVDCFLPPKLVVFTGCGNDYLLVPVKAKGADTQEGAVQSCSSAVLWLLVCDLLSVVWKLVLTARDDLTIKRTEPGRVRFLHMYLTSGPSDSPERTG